MVSCTVKSAVKAFNVVSTVRARYSVGETIADLQTDLSAPVDVYAEWVDACDTVAKDDIPFATSRRLAPGRSAQARDEEATRSDDDIIDDGDASDIDGRGEYGGEDEGIVADDDEY